MNAKVKGMLSDIYDVLLNRVTTDPCYDATFTFGVPAVIAPEVITALRSCGMTAELVEWKIDLRVGEIIAFIELTEWDD